MAESEIDSSIIAGSGDDISPSSATTSAAATQHLKEFTSTSNDPDSQSGQINTGEQSWEAATIKLLAIVAAATAAVAVVIEVVGIVASHNYVAFGPATLKLVWIATLSACLVVGNAREDTENAPVASKATTVVRMVPGEQWKTARLRFAGLGSVSAVAAAAAAPVAVAFAEYAGFAVAVKALKGAEGIAWTLTAVAGILSLIAGRAGRAERNETANSPIVRPRYYVEGALSLIISDESRGEKWKAVVTGLTVAEVGTIVAITAGTAIAAVGVAVAALVLIVAEVAETVGVTVGLEEDLLANTAAVLAVAAAGQFATIIVGATVMKIVGPGAGNKGTELKAAVRGIIVKAMLSAIIPAILAAIVLRVAVATVTARPPGAPSEVGVSGSSGEPGTAGTPGAIKAVVAVAIAEAVPLAKLIAILSIITVAGAAVAEIAVVIFEADLKKSSTEQACQTIVSQVEKEPMTDAAEVVHPNPIEDSDSSTDSEEETKLDSDHKPIPQELTKLIKGLCREHNVKSATIIQSIDNWRNVLVLGINAASIQQQIEEEMQKFPLFSEFKVHTESQDIPFRRKALALKVFKKTKSIRGAELWKNVKFVTSELLVQAEERNKENPNPRGAIYAVVPAHFILTREQILAVRAARGEVAERREAAARREVLPESGLGQPDDGTGCDHYLVYNNAAPDLLDGTDVERDSDLEPDMVMERTREACERKSSKRRYFIQVSRAEGLRNVDLKHPLLLSYRKLIYEDDTPGANCPVEICELEPNNVCQHMFMNDMALLPLDFDDALEIQRSLQQSPHGVPGNIKHIPSLDRFRQYHVKQRIVRVKNAIGKLRYIEMIADNAGEEYGTRVIFVLDSENGTVHKLEDGDCGSIVYLQRKHSTGWKALGMFVSVVEYNTNFPGCDDVCYEAVVLKPAFHDLENAYPHHIGPLRPFRYPMH